MKKVVILSTAVLLLITVFTGCKKGENDPFLSLRSRKARLAGEWTLNYAELALITEQDSTVVSSAISFHDQTEVILTTTKVSGVTTNSVSTSGSCTVKLTIEKDGTYTQVKTKNDETTTTTGTWIFLKQNKESELKNKEAILLTELSSTNASGATITNEGFAGKVYTIDMLKNKEMVWKIHSLTNTGNGSELEDGKYEFVQN